MGLAGAPTASTVVYYAMKLLPQPFLPWITTGFVIWTAAVWLMLARPRSVRLPEYDYAVST
jgi:hypothetical protein